MSTKKPTGGKAGRRRYDPAFKQEAVKLAKEIGYTKAAEDLGVNESNLRNWAQAVDLHGGLAFTGQEQRADVLSENRRLREEVRQLKMEREILKKATAFFAKDLG